MKVLVTGGCGFVGRHLIPKLMRDEVSRVTCVDNLIDSGGGKPPGQWLLEPLLNGRDKDKFEFIQEDCRNYFRHSLNDFDEIYHLAAVVGGRKLIEHSPISVGIDLSIDAEMWQFAVQKPDVKVINFSSSAAYPVSLQGPSGSRMLVESDIDFSSDHLGIPDLTYGWSKLTSEYLGYLAWEKQGIRSVTFRPFSGYGPDQDDAYPFPAILKRAMAHDLRRPFPVWGSGDQSRDFIHIDDCINAVLAIKDQVHDSSAINLCTGRSTSFRDLASLVLWHIHGKEIEVVGTPGFPEGVFSRVGDPRKLLAHSYTPKVSVEDGVKSALLELYPQN